MFLLAWLSSSNKVLPFSTICTRVLKLQWVLPPKTEFHIDRFSSSRWVIAAAGRAVLESYPEQQNNRNKDLNSSAGRKHNHEATIKMLWVVFVGNNADIYYLCWLPAPWWTNPATATQTDQRGNLSLYRVNNIWIEMLIGSLGNHTKKYLTCAQSIMVYHGRRDLRAL